MPWKITKSPSAISAGNGPSPGRRSTESQVGPKQMRGCTGPVHPRICFGPTCDSVDRLPGDGPFPADIAEGDFVIFHGMGAYSTVTNSRFNGFGELGMVTVLSLKL